MIPVKLKEFIALLPLTFSILYPTVTGSGSIHDAFLSEKATIIPSNILGSIQHKTQNKIKIYIFKITIIMFIPISQPSITQKEIDYVNDAVTSTWISSLGKYIDRFETEFADFCQSRYAICVSNGTVAIQLALAAYDIGAGDEVIMPNLSFIATANATLHSGAKPVFADIDPENLCIDPKKIEALITPNTKAIMPVHLYGHPAQMDVIIEIAHKHNLLVIEDAAEAHGATVNGKRVGSWGNCATFSFYGNKNLTTGEGGMITTDDEDFYNRCRYLRDHAMSKEKRYWHTAPGFNFRMTNLQAAVGVAQLEQLDKLVEKKRWIGNLYHELLGDIREFQLPIDQREYAENIYWVFGIVLNDCSYSVQEICTHLSKNKIGTRPFFWPMHEQPVYLKQGLFNDTSLPNSEFLARNGFYLPSGLGITETEIRTVAHCLKDFIND